MDEYPYLFVGLIIYDSLTILKSVFNSLLIIDRATTHFDPDLSNEFERHNAKFVLIPPGLTLLLQPLDVEVNKEIKKFMWTVDANLRIKNNNKHPPTKKEIIDIFCDVFQNKIKCESIINSFKKTGISVKTDGLENHLLIYQKLFCKILITLMNIQKILIKI